MKESSKNKIESIVLDFGLNEDGFIFSSSISSALSEAEKDLQALEERLSESSETLKKLTSECDKTDYILAASCGAICGVMDIFLVDKPKDSQSGEITDKWFADRTTYFAKMCGFNGDESSPTSAIRFLEKKFKIPYDQSVGRMESKEIFNITPNNHHFKSLGHNPTLLGLFFSILDQFSNTSSFISGGELLILKNSESKFELQGYNTTSKLFCGFANWFGHLVSDVSGSSSSKGRGMGIPSPFWCWTNDIIAIKAKLGIPVYEFDNSINTLALEIFKEGYETRFQTAQAIPVFVNETLVRFLYSVRRLFRFFMNTNKEDRTFKLLWKSCEPFSNATVKRMLTVSHGTFCLIDASDATIRGIVSGGGTFNVKEFFIRLNIVGIGRFTISLYGEANRGIKLTFVKKEVYFLNRDKAIMLDYIEGLKQLADVYDDEALLSFVDDLKHSDMHIQAFEKSVALAEKRNVPSDKTLKNKAEIDAYFGGKA